MGVPEWLSIGGALYGRDVSATGINVMRKRGDFPDLDKSLDLASASASASYIASWGQQPHHSHDLDAVKIGVGVGVPLAVLLIALFS